MNLIVQKFGGTSVATLSRINAIIPIIKQERAKGNKVIIVVSAMAGVTNQLITLCSEVSTLVTSDALAEYDAALSTGEMVSSSLLALKLQQEGVSARSVFAWQLPILTNSNHSKAIVESFTTILLHECIDKGIIPVVAGFQGVTWDKRLATLGRGGSDTTAALVSAATKADRCDIYTDVSGVFTADPRIVHQAKQLTEVTFEEMLELASSGAKVLHPRSVEIAFRYRIPMRVLSSFTLDAGTLITSKNDIMEHRLITGITYNQNLFKVSIDNQNISFSRLCTLIAAANVHIELTQNIDTNKQYNFIIQLQDKDKLEQMLIGLKNSNQITSYTIDTKISIVTIVGYGIKNDHTLVGLILTELEKNNIQVSMMYISEIKISLLIEEQNTEKAVSYLHQLLQLDQ